MTPDLVRWLSVRAYGLITSTMFRPRTDPLTMRARFERLGRVEREQLTRRYANLRFSDHGSGPLEIEGVTAVEDPTAALLYLHGGGFFMGSPASYRRRTMKMSYRARAEVFVPAYRLAPEHPFPAALDDALRAYDYVRRARPGLPILLAGDSAGGGLAIALALALRDSEKPAPAGVIAFSPWTDHTSSGRSVRVNARHDRWLTADHLRTWSQYFVGDHDPRDPQVSPVFASFQSLPPFLLIAGGHEILLDDARRVADGVRDAGGEAILHVGPGMQHDFPLTLPWLEASHAAWNTVVEFAARPLRE